MIADKFIDLYARNSGLRDKLVAERDVVLTYALRALLDAGVMDHLAFKGGTCLRKLIFGSAGRFSEDLDFTLATEEEDDDVLVRLVEVFNCEHYGIAFTFDEYYKTDDDTSFGGDVLYRHAWNDAGRFRLQVSLRERPTLSVVPGGMKPQAYFSHLEFDLFDVRSLEAIEMIAEKVRAAFCPGDAVAYEVGRAYQVEVEAFETELLVWVDGGLLCAVSDHELSAGRVGLYTWANQGAVFEGLRVEALERRPMLWRPFPGDLRDWRIVDAPDALEGPSSWVIDGDAISQTSNIHEPTPAALQLGTYAAAGEDHWDDVAIGVTLRSDDIDGAIGIMFRQADETTYYHFSIDAQSHRRRLVRCVEGSCVVLWEEGIAPVVGVEQRLTIRAVGAELTGVLDGEFLFRVHDAAIRAGSFALHTGRNPGAWFSDIVVTDATRTVGAWRIVDESTVDGPSVWRLGSGGLVQTSLIRGGSEAGNDPPKPGTYAIGGSLELADYRFDVTMRSDGDGAIGVVFRWTGVDAYYRFSIDRARGYRRLIRKAGGLVTTLWESAGSYVPGIPVRITIDAVGARLIGQLDGEILFDVRDDAHAAGAIGFYAWRNGGARFERIELRRPPLEARLLFADAFDRDSLAGWTVEDEGTISAPSSWSAGAGVVRQTRNIYSPPLDGEDPVKPGAQLVAGDPTWTDLVYTVRLLANDDDAIGVVFRHQAADRYYRFSMDRERSYRRLVKRVGTTHTVLWEDRGRHELGRTYELTVIAIGERLRGYLDGVPMFDVVDAELTSGRIGLYTWANTDARFAQVRVHEASAAFSSWVLDESFHALSGFRWSFAGEGTWTATGGWLAQTSDVPDAVAVVGDPHWRDLRAIVRVRSGGDGVVGVAFRWNGVDDHYRVELDPGAGLARLIVRVAGASTTLWEEARPLDADRDYLVTIDCMGDRLSAYLDGAPLFALDDASLAEGRIGLVAANSGTARFTDVRVGPARWTPYASSSGGVVAAGTRFEIHAAPAIPATAPGANTVVGHAGGLARFVGSDVRLRLVERTSEGDRVLHERSFLPALAYQPLGFRILRKRDGTGLALALDSEAILSASHLRLRATFARTGVPDAHDLAESGFIGPEQSTLEFAS